METNASSSSSSSSSSNSSSSGSNSGSNDEQPQEPAAMPMDTLEPPPSGKTLKRCLSVPIIRTPAGKATPMTTRAAAAAAAAAKQHEQTPTKQQQQSLSAQPELQRLSRNVDYFGKSIHIRSQPNSREVSPAPMFNPFMPRARRYSASYSPQLSGSNAGGAANATLCITPRVSQLRQEECADLNSREVNHEREVHREMQISQSWEDLTLVAENWSCKSDELSNPLQLALPTGNVNSCSSPSPTSNRAGMRLPYSPSPTRRTFATRRSMSPIAMRPSSLGPVKRKFELDDATTPGASNWSVYSPPPLKKIFTESRGSSPVCQSPSSVCPSPDSGTYDGRITPKLFISKLCTNNNSSSSGCPSPVSASPSNVLPANGLDAMLSQSQSLDEGISIAEQEHSCSRSRTSSLLSSVSASSSNMGAAQLLVNDMADDATLMDDAKSETSSIGGCSTISIESSSCDSGAKAAASFLHRLAVDESVTSTSPASQKSFYINKQGLSGAKKFIVNHEASKPPSKQDVLQKL
ncbi:CG4497 [Drosophila busckii]|uniref:CG4497 n=1 Tax=Drosophila busckii TaxID=30019 RepID=A0A0M4E5H1_DROBS|nr:CG4497 [Drosophila busckii]